MKITAYGAAEGVTGTKHLLELNGHRVLLDCGMFQGPRREAELRNREIPVPPETIDAVILSHAHIDHSGILPVLTKHGYKGKVYTTCATRDLCSVMLLDSAHIQARDAEWLSKKERSYTPPLYDVADAQEVLKRIICFPYDVKIQVLPDMYVTFRDAGHVLGSAMIEVEYKDDGTSRKFLFTGDLGRRNMPILKDPWLPGDFDAVMMESTYGDRDHDPIQTMEDKLAAVVRETYDRGGKIIVPSFALERAQEVIYALKNLELRDAIPPFPVYVDSPLTVDITQVFRMHPECFDEDMSRMIREVGDAFKLRDIQYITSAQDSMRLNSLKEPCMIISAAGMCEHGRILHHLRNNCEDPKNTIMIVGFQAKNTLGRRIVERQPRIKIFGIERELNAHVKIMNGFSAHAGRTELVEFGLRFKQCAKRIMLVHGEPTALEALQGSLHAGGAEQAEIMREGQTVAL